MVPLPTSLQLVHVYMRSLQVSLRIVYRRITVNLQVCLGNALLWYIKTRITLAQRVLVLAILIQRECHIRHLKLRSLPPILILLISLRKQIVSAFASARGGVAVDLIVADSVYICHLQALMA